MQKRTVFLLLAPLEVRRAISFVREQCLFVNLDEGVRQPLLCSGVASGRINLSNLFKGFLKNVILLPGMPTLL